MMSPTLAGKMAQIAAKGIAGTTITLAWSEWPNGQPAIDATTGARLVTANNASVEKQCQTKALVHFASPSTMVTQQNTLIQSGDAIVDFVTPLLRITSAGDTALTVGQVVDQWALNAENRKLDAGGDKAFGSSIQLESLAQLFILIDGVRYVQAKTGGEVLKSWDTLAGNVKVIRTLHFTISL